MARVEINEYVRDPNGRPFPQASAQVNVRGGAAATVYVAATGGTTKANPVITDAVGRIEGWVEEGSYDLVCTAGVFSYTQAFEAIAGTSAAAVGGLDTRLSSVESTQAQLVTGRGELFDLKAAPYNCAGNLSFVGGVATGTDDTAGILLALADLQAAGGGRLRVYRHFVSTVLNGSGIKYCLGTAADNITFEKGEENAEIATDEVDAAVLFMAGSGKPEGLLNWVKYAPWRFAGDTFAGGAAITPASPNVSKAINAAAEGDASVTLVTAGDASNYVVGDYVYIRSGQRVTNASNWNAEPSAEVNRIRSIAGGVLGLEQPLCRPYVQEYQSAIGQVSSTTVAAVLTPLAITKLGANCQVNIRNEGVKFTSLDTAAVTTRGAIWGIGGDWKFKTRNGPAFDTIEYRGGRFGTIESEFTGTGDFLWAFVTATGTVDVIVDRVVGLSATGMPCLHLHEDSTDIVVRWALLRGIRPAGTFNTISIRGGARRVEVQGYAIAGGALSGAAVFIDEFCTGGGKIGKGTIRGPYNGTSIRTIISKAAGWEIEPPDDGIGGDVYLDLALPVSPCDVQYLRGWVTAANQGPRVIGRLPAQSCVLRPQFVVQQAFNSSGTDLARLGVSADPNAFSSGIDVSTVGVKDGSVTFGYLDNAFEVLAEYQNGGTEPATGKMFVIVPYMPMGPPAA